MEARATSILLATSSSSLSSSSYFLENKQSGCRSISQCPRIFLLDASWRIICKDCINIIQQELYNLTLKGFFKHFHYYHSTRCTINLENNSKRVKSQKLRTTTLLKTIRLITASLYELVFINKYKKQKFPKTLFFFIEPVKHLHFSFH